MTPPCLILDILYRIYSKFIKTKGGFENQSMYAYMLCYDTTLWILGNNKNKYSVFKMNFVGKRHKV